MRAGSFVGGTLRMGTGNEDTKVTQEELKNPSRKRSDRKKNSHSGVGHCPWGPEQSANTGRFLYKGSCGGNPGKLMVLWGKQKRTGRAPSAPCPAWLYAKVTRRLKRAGPRRQESCTDLPRNDLSSLTPSPHTRPGCSQPLPPKSAASCTPSPKNNTPGPWGHKWS